MKLIVLSLFFQVISLMLSLSDFRFFGEKMGSFLRINRMEYFVVSQISIFKKHRKRLFVEVFAIFYRMTLLFSPYFTKFTRHRTEMCTNCILTFQEEKAIKFDLTKQTWFDQRHISVSMASFLFAFFL